MWRQGDVLIERIDSVPGELPRVKRLILASGDSSGQRHQIKERGVAELYRSDSNSDLFLTVTGDQATVVHPEHHAIILTKGSYRVWKQQEFAEVRPRPVYD